MVSPAIGTAESANEETRAESDSLGELRIPASAYYGVQTMRAQQNFPISDLRFPRRFIRAIAQIKAAAAETNMDLHLIDEKIAIAVRRARRAKSPTGRSTASSCWTSSRPAREHPPT